MNPTFFPIRLLLLANFLFLVGALPALADTLVNLHTEPSVTVSSSTPYTSVVIDASTHENLTLSFDYNAEGLDSGDILSYGWSNGGTYYELGTIFGLNEGEASLPGDETGARSVSLPVGAQIATLEIKLSLAANSASDNVQITNLKVDSLQPSMFILTGNKYEIGEEFNAPRSGWIIYASSSEERHSTSTKEDGSYSFSVVAGEWEVTEEIKTGWVQITVERNGDVVDTEGSETEKCTFVLGNESEAVSGNCDFYNQNNNEPEPEVVLRAPVGGGGSRAIPSARTDSQLISSSTITPTVLGASTSQCGPLLRSYLKMGEDNDPYEVMKLQAFLVGQGYFTVIMNGVFDTATNEAVKAFQEAHREEILTPWVTAGILTQSNPTGWVYQLTKWKINNTVCEGGEPLPTLIP